jgi:hypothetical protein
MKTMTGLALTAWLVCGCVTTIPGDDTPGAAEPDARTGLCNDATPPPCNPPRD